MKKIASLDKVRCVACGACIKACPKGAIQVLQGCYAQVNEYKCLGCGKCEKACPAGCIEITAREVLA